MKVLNPALFYIISLSLFGLFCNSASDANGNSSQQPSKKQTLLIRDSHTVSGRFRCPIGYKRSTDSTLSFGTFLQSFPLHSANRDVMTFDGMIKTNKVHAAVLDIDVGTRDLQQCADAVMRLRAEYLYNVKEYEKISFRFLGDGKMHSFLSYSKGKKDYRTFRKYMDYVFAFANTASLKKQLKVRNIANIKIGDVFIQSGNPYGHAVIIMDLCEDSTGNKQALLAQSYMPAQDIHILKNFQNTNNSPWFEMKEGQIITPEWTFDHTDLKHF